MKRGQDGVVNVGDVKGLKDGLEAASLEIEDDALWPERALRMARPRWWTRCACKGTSSA
jgi:hypothetical protein